MSDVRVKCRRPGCAQYAVTRGYCLSTACVNERNRRTGTGAPPGARRMVATVEFDSYAPASDLTARVRETIETHPTLSFRVVSVSVAERRKEQDR